MDWLEPTGTAFLYHWYVGVPPLVLVAVNVTGVPWQILFWLTVMVEVTGRMGLTTIVMVLDVAGLPARQVRFEVTIRSLDPSLKILAPVREWEMKTRSEEIEYAKKNNIPIDATKKKPYSLDVNLW